MRPFLDSNNRQREKEKAQVATDVCSDIKKKKNEETIASRPKKSGRADMEGILCNSYYMFWKAALQWNLARLQINVGGNRWLFGSKNIFKQNCALKTDFNTYPYTQIKLGDQHLPRALKLLRGCFRGNPSAPRIS